jgi:hypothetical protein
VVQFANIVPSAPTDGVPYAVNFLLTSQELDIFNGPAADLHPVPITFDQAIFAIVQFVAGQGASQPSYVVMQTDLGDGVWIDVSSCQWTGTSGQATFVLSGGVGGANSFQQTRAAGTNPGNTFQQCPLGGRVRFVGKTGPSASSPSPSPSSPSVVGPPMQVTVKYRLLGLR